MISFRLSGERGRSSAEPPSEDRIRQEVDRARAPGRRVVPAVRRRSTERHRAVHRATVHRLVDGEGGCRVVDGVGGRSGPAMLPCASMPAPLLSLAGLVLAATLAPPAGEAVLPWEAAARLAGLSLGDPGAPDGVTLQAVGGQLRVLAVDAAGHQKSLLVPWPDTAAERESAVALGASLLRSLEAPVRRSLVAVLVQRSVGPAAPAAAVADADKRSVTPVVQPAVVHAAPVGELARADLPPIWPRALPPAQEAAPEFLPVVPSDSTVEALNPVPRSVAPALPLLPENSPPAPLRPWARLGPALGWRGSTTLSSAVLLEAGLRAGETFRLGVHGAWDAPRGVVDVGESASVRGWALEAGAWWSPAWRVAPLLGLRAGATWRGFLDDSEPVDGVWVPQATVEGGVAWRLSPAMSLLACAYGSRDLRETTVQVGQGPRVLFSPGEAGASTSLRLDFP